MKNLIFNFFAITICIFFLALLKSYASNHIIKTLEVIGNNRIDDATIINYSGISAGDLYSADVIDKSLKKLYETELFSNVEIKYRIQI